MVRRHDRVFISKKKRLYHLVDFAFQQTTKGEIKESKKTEQIP